ncbi:MAG: DUF72 domain-containing protein [Candidatus Palauibacterales bacterium]|nr:DUF72 domain-containing protein [Candidatus Palauibacterales bacterium]
MTRFRVGTSGYDYPHWDGVFYPRDLPAAQRFGYYAGHFDTVEINNTFYGLPDRSTFRVWRERAPKDFLYVLKFSRFGSHMKHLKDPEETIGNFLDAASGLGDRLGPILVQLPPSWNADPERLDAFLEVATRERRWAVEFRDESWLRDEVFEVLRDHGAALCVHDMLEDHPRLATADWVYLRFHGVLAAKPYSRQYLTARARDVDDHLDAGRDVFAFFNNDREGRAVDDALDLHRYVANRRHGD